MMRAGSLRHVIKIQRSTETINAAGTPVITWADLVTLRAEILEQRDSESIGAQGASDRKAVDFRTWHNGEITNADRIMFNGAALNIRQIEPDPQFRTMIIQTETVQP